MRFADYIKDKTGILLLHAACMLLLFIFLLAMGNSVQVVVLILVAWIAVLGVWLVVAFAGRKKYFDQIQQAAKFLEKPYLLAEVIRPTWRLEDKLYHSLMQKTGKAALEEIRRKEDEQREYKEFIEGWVHEAKTPVTAMELLCGNLEQECPEMELRRMRLALRQMEQQIDTVLYYARMEQTWKDYLIARTNLRRAVVKAVQRNRLFFMDKKMQVKVEMEDIRVSTDEKWVLFILERIFSNSIKYSRETGGIVRVTAAKVKNGVELCIFDNGMGIKPEELGRIFEKGFCGSNGRIGQYSTGIGLYLCRKLCQKLDIGIRAESGYGKFTCIYLRFPDSEFSSEAFKNERLM